MNLINQSLWIFIAIVVALVFVGFNPSPLSMGLFTLLTTGLMIYQVIITLKDDSDNLDEELADITDQLN